MDKNLIKIYVTIKVLLRIKLMIKKAGKGIKKIFLGISFKFVTKSIGLKAFMKIDNKVEHQCGVSTAIINCNTMENIAPLCSCY